MILVYDTETYESTEDGLSPVLNCQEFTIGGLLKEGWKKPRFYNNPNDMVKAMFDLIEKEAKRGGTTYIYAHTIVTGKHWTI